MAVDGVQFTWPCLLRKHGRTRRPSSIASTTNVRPPVETNGLLPLLQSAYRSHHSTETALLKVLSDVLTAIDDMKVTLLALLDLSAAFDCVDHDILLSTVQAAVQVWPRWCCTVVDLVFPD